MHADVSARIEGRRPGVTENSVSGNRRQIFFANAATTRPAPGDVGDSAGKVARQAGKPIRVGESDASG
jgi:hypothetical protein